MQIDKKSIAYVLVLLGVAGTLGLLHDKTTSNNPTCAVDMPKALDKHAKTAKGRTKMSNATAVSTVDFDEQVLKADGPVMVDFWAPWCMPCKMLAPTLDELAADYTGKIKIVKVNTDENQALAAKYGIKGIPTLIIFKDGEPVDRMTGVQPKNVLTEKIDQVVQE